MLSELVEAAYEGSFEYALAGVPRDYILGPECEVACAGMIPRILETPSSKDG